MAPASKPVSGEPIASAWGQQVHDAAVLNRGVIVSGATVTGGASVKLPLDTVLGGDPSMADLGTNEFVAPVDGLYELTATLSASGVSGSNGVYFFNTYVGAVNQLVSCVAPFRQSGSASTGNLAGHFLLTAGQRLAICGEGSSATSPSGTPTQGLTRGVFRLVAAGLGAA